MRNYCGRVCLLDAEILGVWQMTKAKRPRFGTIEGEREELWRLCEDGWEEHQVPRRVNDWLKARGFPPRDPRTIKLHFCAWQGAMRDINKDEIDTSKKANARYYEHTTKEDILKETHRALKQHKRGQNAIPPDVKPPKDDSQSDERGRRNRTDDPAEAILKERHVSRLFELAGRIRDMIHAYHPETLPYIQDAPDNNLMIGSDDWSLEPWTWVSLVVPDLDDEKLWGDDFASFRAHTQSSPFWSNYEKLSEEAKSLETDLDQAAARLIERTPWIADQWRKLRRAGDPWSVAISRTPAFPDDTEDERPSVSNSDTKRILHQLARDGYDFSSRFYALKRILQQLRDDLKPDSIERCICEGECDACRQGG